MNRQKKIDIIARRKAAKLIEETAREKEAVTDLDKKINDLNHVSPVRDSGRRSLRRDDVLIEFDDDDSEEISSTKTATSESFSSESKTGENNSITNNTLNDADANGSENDDFDKNSECPFESELQKLDEDHDDFISSTHIKYTSFYTHKLIITSNKLIELAYIPCAAHNIQLVIKDGLVLDNKINDL